MYIKEVNIKNRASSCYSDKSTEAKKLRTRNTLIEDYYKDLVICFTPTMDEISEKNVSFFCEIVHYRNVQFLFSRSLLLVLVTFSFWEEDWALGYTSMTF